MNPHEIVDWKLEPALRDCRLHERRLFPSILMLGGDYHDDQTFLDRLDILEKLGAIPSTDQWNQIRAIRNKMTNEYPDAPELNAANLNRVVDSIEPIRQALDQAEEFARDLAARVAR